MLSTLELVTVTGIKLGKAAKTNMFSEENYEITMTLQTDIYPLEIIYLACYTLTEEAYFYIKPEGISRGINDVIVAIKRKNEPERNSRPLQEIIWDFRNSLTAHAGRLATSKRNREIRKHIIGRALESARNFGKEKIEENK
jgi:His-Xaa-Ser system protein HxsD